MLILKRKEIVAASLVLLIGMAGYLNWHYQDVVRVTDGESYIETGKKLGEAKYVMNTEEVEEKTTEPASDPKPKASADYFEQSKSDRETARAKSLEVLNETAANENFDKEIRKKAQEQIIKIADEVQSESAIENLAKAKGYDKICVYESEENVNVTVQKDGFSDTAAAKILDIVTQQLKISPNKVKIVEVK